MYIAIETSNIAINKLYIELNDLKSIIKSYHILKSLTSKERQHIYLGLYLTQFNVVYFKLYQTESINNYLLMINQLNRFFNLKSYSNLKYTKNLIIEYYSYIYHENEANLLQTKYDLYNTDDIFICKEKILKLIFIAQKDVYNIIRRKKRYKFKY